MLRPPGRETLGDRGGAPQAMGSMDTGRELYHLGMCYHRSHPHLMQKCFSCVLDIIGYTLDAEHLALFFTKTCLEVLK